jgi:hypothetical protein
MKTFRIIFIEKSLKYKIQRRLLWGLIWYDVEEEVEIDPMGFEYASYPIYFNRIKDAEDYIHTHFTKGKEFVVKTFILR